MGCENSFFFLTYHMIFPFHCINVFINIQIVFDRRKGHNIATISPLRITEKSASRTLVYINYIAA